MGSAWAALVVAEEKPGKQGKEGLPRLVAGLRLKLAESMFYWRNDDECFS